MAFFSSICFGQTANTYVNVMPLATQTSTTINSPTQQNFNYRGGHFIISVTTVAAGTYTPHIQGFNATDGKWYDILVGLAISANGDTVLKVYPGIAEIPNGAANDILPQTWRIQMIGASTPSAIFSVDAYLEL